MELPSYVIYLAIGLISFVIVSPKIHIGLVCTLGLSIVGLGLLGLALQEHELGNHPRFGVTGQWQAIKIGLIVAGAGLVLNWFKPHKTISHPREISAEEQRHVSGGNSEPGGN